MGTSKAMTKSTQTKAKPASVYTSNRFQAQIGSTSSVLSFGRSVKDGPDTMAVFIEVSARNMVELRNLLIKAVDRQNEKRFEAVTKGASKKH